MVNLLRCAGRLRFAFAAAILIVLSAGCSSSPVADDLSQREANKIVAALRERGVDSSTEKERGSRGRYSVVVASSQFGQAASLLAEMGLPEERRASFSELTAQSGFLPSSHEVESLRLDRALAAEMEDLLHGHPSVADATVMVRYHSLSESGASSISVVVQKKHESALTSDEVRALVSRALPNVRQEDIMVTVSEAQSASRSCTGYSEGGDASVPFLVYWTVPASQYNSLAGLLIGLLLFVAGLAALGGYIFGQYTFSKYHVVGRLESGVNATSSSPRVALQNEQNEEGEG